MKTILEVFAGWGLLRYYWRRVWEQPQTLIGWAIYRWLVRGMKKDRRLPPGIARGSYDGALICEVSWRWGGVSFGEYIYVKRLVIASTQTVMHEYGHTRQSRMLGPLYLPLVGLPSVLRRLWAMKVVRPLDRERWYYSGYPERWADRLSGVMR